MGGTYSVDIVTDIWHDPRGTHLRTHAHTQHSDLTNMSYAAGLQLSQVRIQLQNRLKAVCRLTGQSVTHAPRH